MTDKASVDLSGAAQTMLTTLYLKALDADFERPVLGDRFAKEAVGRLDYDWREIGITGRWAPLVTVRTAQYDIWARQFLAVHEHATVVHLGCGLDSRVFRLDPGPGVEWYDVDYPAVIALREKIYPTRPRYHLVATSATDPSWLDQIPADRPVLLLAEGISMYLTEHEGVALLRRVVDRFPSGELQIDFYNWLGIRSQKTQTLVRRSGSTLHWAVNSPEDILQPSPRSPIADRRFVLRREHVQPGIDWVPVGEAPGSRGPARAQGAAIPPLRVRTRQLTPVAACCSAMVQSSERIASIDLSGAGACEWYSIIQLPGEYLREVHVDSGVDGEVQVAVARRSVPRSGGVRTGGTRPLSVNMTTSGKPGWIPDVLRAEVKQ